MSKMKGIFLINLVYLLFMIYTVYEGLNLTGVNNYEDFVESYLNNVQKYLFNITLLTVGVLYFLKISFLKPEFRIRYGEDIAYLLIIRGVKISIFLTLYIYLLFIFVPLVFGYEVNFFEISLTDITRLFSYIYYLYLLYTLFYIIAESEVFGILGTLSLNLLIIIIYIGVTFYVLQDEVPREVGLHYLMTFTSLINIIGSLYLFYRLKHKECL